MIALLCSGQGGQHRDMFRLTAGAGEAAPVFDAAETVLGTDPLRFVVEAGEASLFDNRAAQILCCTQALAAWSLISPFLPERVMLAGYSVGELAAWGCAGWFGTAQTLRLAAERAACMDTAIEADGLAGVVGPDRKVVESLLDGRGFVAIVNAADSHVVGGSGEAFTAALDELRRAGARVRRLPVGVASHTPLFRAASERFASVLAGETLGKPDGRVRLLRGIDGETVRGGAVEALASGLSRPIDWKACRESCREAGASRFLELGPGEALARMEGASGRSVEAFRTPDGLREWLARE